MSAKTQSFLKIPQHFKFQKRVDGNLIQQVNFTETITECTLELYKTTIVKADTPIFGTFYLTLPRNKYKPPSNSKVLKVKSQVKQLSEINLDTKLEWEEFPSEGEGDSPNEIVNSWSDKFVFKQERPDKGQEGLRTPQLGALHAISAHLSVSTDTATVVMPTGTGKTETMLSVLTYSQCLKVLVLVPSDALRKQLSDKFITLGYLPILKILPDSILRPKVATIKKGIKDPLKAQELVDNSNVIVATPDSLRAFSQEALKVVTGTCSHLFIDEAHHVAAPSWRAIKEAFTGKHIIQFTATPFRRDGGNLEGTVIFNY